MGIRTINGPSTPTTETASTAQPRFQIGPEHEQPRNKIQQGIAPYGAQGAPRLNADVRQDSMIFSNGILSTAGDGKLSTATVTTLNIQTKTPGGQL